MINGIPAETIRANYVLRALKIPAGTHQVEWRCETPSGSAVPILANSVLLILILGSSWYGMKHSKT